MWEEEWDLTEQGIGESRAFQCIAMSQGSGFCRWDRQHGGKESSILRSVVASSGSGLGVLRSLTARRRWRVLHLTFWGEACHRKPRKPESFHQSLIPVDDRK